MARPTKLSKERGEKIAKLIKAGNYSSQAAAAAGVSESTYYRWCSKGKEVARKYESWLEDYRAWEELTVEEQEANPHLKPLDSEGPNDEDFGFLQFWELIKKSEAEAEAAAVVQIKQAASSGTWQAAAWFLERKFKDRWARTDRLEGTVNHTIGIAASDEEIEAAKRRLKQARALPSSPTEDIIEAEIIEDTEE